MIDLTLSESEARTLARMLAVHRPDLPQYDHLASEIAEQMRGQMMPTYHLRQIWEQPNLTPGVMTGKGERPMSEAPTLIRCPRCEAALINDRAALSRTTRDDGAEVFVCDRCGQREGLYGRDSADQVPLSDWPVPVERLLQEERVLIEQFRGSTLTMIRTDELTGEDDR